VLIWIATRQSKLFPSNAIETIESGLARYSMYDVLVLIHLKNAGIFNKEKRSQPHKLIEKQQKKRKRQPSFPLTKAKSH
jgi:hypothetical protein